MVTSFAVPPSRLLKSLASLAFFSPSPIVAQVHYADKGLEPSMAAPVDLTPGEVPSFFDGGGFGFGEPLVSPGINPNGGLKGGATPTRGVFSMEELERQLLGQASPAQPALGGEGAGGKQGIVVDGQNVASQHNPFNNGYQNVDAVRIVVDFWRGRDHPCVALVPARWLRESRSGGETSALPRLRAMVAEGLVHPIPEEKTEAIESLPRPHP